MQLDVQTVATLASLVVAFVAVTKFLIPDGKNQNNEVRLLSAVTGAILFALFAVTHEATLAATATGRDLLDAAGQGFLAGAFGSAGVKAYHLGGDAVSKLVNKTAS